MERLPGSTLRDEIIARGPLSPSRVLLVMAETLDALAAAHGRGVLHRDIKPSNILLEQDGHTKITDFGIAKSFDVRARPTPLPDDATMTGVVLGTPGYLAPERRSGQLATVQSDLYAVGAVMVEALTGKRLGPDPVPTGSIPLPLRDVARRAMATDPRRRFSSANEMFQALRVAAGGASQTMRPSRAQQTAPHTAATTRTATQGTAMLGAARPAHDRPARTRRRMLALATVAVLALAGGVFFVLSNGTEPTAPAVTHHVRTQALARQGPQGDGQRRCRPDGRRRNARRRRAARRRPTRERPPGDGRPTPRGAAAGRRPAGALPGRGTPRWRRHYIGAVPGRRQRPAGGRCDRADDHDHHHDHDDPRHGAPEARTDALLPGPRARSRRGVRRRGSGVATPPGLRCVAESEGDRCRYAQAAGTPAGERCRHVNRAVVRGGRPPSEIPGRAGQANPSGRQRPVRRGDRALRALPPRPLHAADRTPRARRRCHRRRDRRRLRRAHHRSAVDAGRYRRLPDHRKGGRFRGHVVLEQVPGRTVRRRVLRLPPAAGGDLLRPQREVRAGSGDSRTLPRGSVATSTCTTGHVSRQRSRPLRGTKHARVGPSSPIEATACRPDSS